MSLMSGEQLEYSNAVAAIKESDAKTYYQINWQYRFTGEGYLMMAAVHCHEIKVKTHILYIQRRRF